MRSRPMARSRTVAQISSEGSAACGEPSQDLPGVQGCRSRGKNSKDSRQCAFAPRMCQDVLIRSTARGGSACRHHAGRGLKDSTFVPKE